jgi:hypothetical protein
MRDTHDSFVAVKSTDLIRNATNSLVLAANNLLAVASVHQRNSNGVTLFGTTSVVCQAALEIVQKQYIAAAAELVELSRGQVTADGDDSNQRPA